MKHERRGPWRREEAGHCRGRAPGEPQRMRRVAGAPANGRQRELQREVEEQLPQQRALLPAGGARELVEEETDARLEGAAQIEAEAARTNRVVRDRTIDVVDLVAQCDSEPGQIVRRKRRRLDESSDLFEAAAANESGDGRNEIASHQAARGVSAPR